MKGELPGATGRLISLRILWDGVEDRSVYPFCVPALVQLEELSFDRPATFLIGENGSGKSTLIEGLAVAAGLNPEGGSRNTRFATRASHSSLHEHLRLAWRGVPHRAFFLRAESFYNVASHYEELPGSSLPQYHGFSHGESFLEVIRGHFRGPGLYLMDEPESALSVMGQLQLLAHMDRSIARGGQFVISSHSPILTAFPGAVIYRLNEHGVREVGYPDTEPYQLTRSFLESPPAFLRHLFAEIEADEIRG